MSSLRPLGSPVRRAVLERLTTPHSCRAAIGRQLKSRSHTTDTEAALPPSPKVSPARDVTWSASQQPKSRAMTGPRFEQTHMAAQPNPLPAIELIKKEPIRLVDSRVAVCDGGGGALGHPKIFINLDPPGPQPCGQVLLHTVRSVLRLGTDCDTLTQISRSSAPFHTIDTVGSGSNDRLTLITERKHACLDSPALY